MKPGALNGVRVIDLSTSVSGAWCARMLADFGADVALYEGPDGHPARSLAPFDGAGNSVIAEYVLANRRSAVVDLEQPGGLEAIHAAVESADVLVCSSSCKYLRASSLSPLSAWAKPSKESDSIKFARCCLDFMLFTAW